MSTTDQPPPVVATPCPLCGGRGVLREEVRDVVFGKPGSFAIEDCQACAHAYLSPRPDREGIGWYYRDWWSQDGGWLQVAEALDSPFIRMLLRARLRLIGSHARLEPGDRVLDVGCGQGGFLRELHAEWGCTDLHGIDNAPALISHQLPVFRGMTFHGTTLQEVELPPGHFSLVTANHALEHTHDPLDELRHMYAFVRPGGWVSIEVPNDRSFWGRLLGRYWFSQLAPYHLQFFSRESLEKALREAGFTEAVHVRTRPQYFDLTAAAALWLTARIGRREEASGPVVLLHILASWVLLFLFLLVDLPGSLLLHSLDRGSFLLGVAQRPGGRPTGTGSRTQGGEPMGPPLPSDSSGA